MERRKFLRLGAFGALAGTGFASLMARAASSDYKATVCVFLSGGCDANNMIVPNDDAGYARYATGRQALAIPRTQLLSIATRTAGAFGLHPAMSDMQRLFNQGKLAMLANVGTLIRPTTKEQANSGNWPLPDNLMSHIDQQNQWSALDTPTADLSTGWGGRMADALMAINPGARFPAAVSVAGSSLFCDGLLSASTAVDAGGGSGFPGTSGSGIDSARLAALSQIAADAGGPQLHSAYSGSLAATIAQSGAVSRAFRTTLSTLFPTTDIGQQLYRVAQLISARSSFGLSRQVFYVELGGFDTHAGQSADLQGLLAQLSQAMSAFYAATVELGVAENVVTFTHSEFSRTLQPAGDQGDGSDHAWGGHSLILGGAVNGGDMYGTFPRLVLGGPDDMADEGRWIPTTSVDQYAGTIASWMGVPDAGLDKVLPNLANFQQKRLGFL